MSMALLGKTIKAGVIFRNIFFHERKIFGYYENRRGCLGAPRRRRRIAGR
jgi:hypothetical protein